MCFWMFLWWCFEGWKTSIFHIIFYCAMKQSDWLRCVSQRAGVSHSAEHVRYIKCTRNEKTGTTYGLNVWTPFSERQKDCRKTKKYRTTSQFGFLCLFLPVATLFFLIHLPGFSCYGNIICHFIGWYPTRISFQGNIARTTAWSSLQSFEFL